MLSKIWIINLVLAALIAVSWVGIWSIRHAQEPSIPAISDISVSDAALEKTKAAEKKPQEASAYDSIVEKNLFSPDRMANITAQDSQAAAGDLKISGEKVMLYGVVMIGGEKMAMINNPSKGTDNREYRWVREGDHISNLNVAQIKKDQIVLKDGFQQYQISLFDPDKEKKKEAARTIKEEPKVISTGSADQSAKSNAETGAPEVKSSAPNKEAAKAEEAGKPRESQKDSRVPFKETKRISPDGKYEIIETPLGAARVKIKK
jgi:hypothetical protein